MSEITYQERCDYATTSQGLDPAVNALRAAGYEVSVDQTGGYTMCVVVPCVKGTVVVTANDYAHENMRCPKCKRDDMQVQDPATFATCAACGHQVLESEIDEPDDEWTSLLWARAAQARTVQTLDFLVGEYPGALWYDGEVDSGPTNYDAKYHEAVQTDSLVGVVRTAVDAFGGAR